MIILLLGFYGFAFLLAVNRPNYFLLFYLLATTKFLGFLDPATFIVGGIEVGYFGVNMIALFSVFFKKDWVELPKNSSGILFLVILLLAYGIFRPILNDYSTIKQSLIASKDTWYYLFFVYILVYYKNIDIKVIIKFIKNISFYFTILYFLFLVFPAIIPPAYDGGNYVKTFFPTYISLAFFLYLIEIKMNKEKDFKKYAIILFLLAGMYFAEHSSLTVMSFLFGVLYLFAFDENLLLKKTTITKLVAIALFGASMALIFIHGLYDSIIDSINAIVYSEDLALRTRDLYNKFRWEAINKQKLFGYGFIHQSAKLMNEIKMNGSSAFMERFTVIDSGYVDLLIKFGYVGTTIILTTLNRYFMFGFFKKYRNHITLAMSMYLVQYLFINYTWSVYTFSMGIIPAALAFYIILMYQDFKIEDQYNYKEI